MDRVAGHVRIPYDPKTTRLLAFRDHVPRFLDGSDTPRAYLERCIEVIERREPEIHAFVVTNIPSARKAADASTERYRAGRPLSPIDGMPFAIKDSFETIDMPTQLNSPVYKGWQSFRDAAHVYAMRRGGAAILGKTQLTEMAIAGPAPTRNPFDTSRNSGGSSSGSAAAVGAMMLPVASGTQARGSMVRPAGYCGTYGFKPTLGAINQGGVHCMTMTHHHVGVLAGTLRDMWETAFYIAETVGGDPGQPGLYGEAALPPAAKPDSIIRLYTRGWSVTDEQTKLEFERFIGMLGKEVKILSRADDPRIEALEQALERIPEFLFPMLSYEMRWPACHYRDDKGQDMLNDEIKSYLAAFEKMTPTEYRVALKRRDQLRALFAQVREISPYCIAPAQPSAALEGLDIGDPVYGDVTSVLGTPVTILPVMMVDGLPFGAQLIGHPHEDYPLCGAARWLADWAIGG